MGCVDLVPDDDLRCISRADFGQNAVHSGNLLHAIRTGGIHHMQQQIRVCGFFQRGMKGCDQRMGQVADEAHGIGQDNLPDFRQKQAPRGGVQRGKQLVGRIGARFGQRVEQRGFAGIGIAHQGNAQQLATTAGTTLHGALALQLLESALEHGHPLAQQTAVGFQLGFTRATQTDPAFLSSQVSPATHQAGGQMFQLGQLDLQLAFVGLGTQGKNIEDQGISINHAAGKDFFQIALLAGTQFVIENHNIGLLLTHGGGDFFRLALAGVGGGIRRLALAADDAQYPRTGTGGQQLELRQLLGMVAITKVQLHQDGAHGRIVVRHGPVHFIHPVHHAHSTHRGFCRQRMGRVGKV